MNGYWYDDYDYPKMPFPSVKCDEIYIQVSSCNRARIFAVLRTCIHTEFMKAATTMGEKKERNMKSTHLNNTWYFTVDVACQATARTNT